MSRSHPETTKLKLSIDGDVLWLTLNDPAKLNALDAIMAEELRQVIDWVSAEPRHFRCMVLTGAGRGFCAGGSVSMMGDVPTPEQTDTPKISLGSHHHHVLKKLSSLPFPIITAINGAAAGLGFSYALTGDYVLASRSAFFLASFNRIGVSPDGGLSWLLPKLIGWAKAKEVLLLGERLQAEDALNLGLINAVVDDDALLSEADQIAKRLSAGPTVALGATRRLLLEGWTNDLGTHLDREEAVQIPTFATEDAREGPVAMMEKREPKFRGR